MIRKADLELKSKWKRRFQNLPEDSRNALKLALQDLRKDALKKAEYYWEKHKAPMALYWKVIGVYSGHLMKTL